MRNFIFIDHFSNTLPMKHRHYKICSIQTVLRHKLSIQEEDIVILITLIIIKKYTKCNIPNLQPSLNITKKDN